MSAQGSEDVKAAEPQTFVESEQLLSDRESWELSGLRVDLGSYQEFITGRSPAPSGSIKGVHIGVGARLDEEWSLSGALRYGVGSEGLGGLNFSGMVSGMYHRYGFGLGLGLGVIGVEEQPDTRPDPSPELANEIVASYTLPESSLPLSRCVGFGPLAALTALYRLPITSIFGLKIGAQVNLARLTCEQSTDRVEPDTAQGIVIRQYWDRWGWSLFGGLSWR